MTTKLAGALAATLAVGILVGAAGAVLVHDTTGASMAMSDTGDMGHVSAMSAMSAMSDTGDMGQMHEMMSKMGGSNMGHEASMDPVDHAQHHVGSDQ